MYCTVCFVSSNSVNACLHIIRVFVDFIQKLFITFLENLCQEVSHQLETTVYKLCHVF